MSHSKPRTRTDTVLRSAFVAYVMAAVVLTGTIRVHAQEAPKKNPSKTHGASSSGASPTNSGATGSTANASAASATRASASNAGPAVAVSTVKPESSPTAATTPTDALPNLPMDATIDITDTREDPKQKYYFVGLRYRGTVIPQFLLNLFVDDGATIYSNSIGAEFDIRSGSNSLIPWIAYTDYNTGDILFLQKGQQDIASNRAVVNSSLKAVYLGLDELWSIPLSAPHLDFEFGFGVGIGAVFGSLMDNWVYQTNTFDPGPYHSTNGNNYALCTSVAPPSNLAPGLDYMTDGCPVQNHSTGGTAKVGRYNEKNWFNGGALPVVFPYISIPQIGLRYKPIKEFETRLGIGLSLTGLWFGLSVDYGLEKTTSDAAHTARLQSRTSDTL
jgi:hypothetical protein